ncbi:abortive infection system antitoxin AbiGi family protein [Nonomuraea sp. GTA35]|uniref:abortive infection system antitoxin AbiGi family protein n=1 Tax=Nonomuraea sp. GTA35 TaxID=1676746 RepID=UPI0035BFBA69
MDGQPIDHILQRRTDLSTFIVHFTRDTSTSARDNILSILTSGQIRANASFGMAAEQLRNTPYEATQRVACFTETPIEHAWAMSTPIAGRNVRLSQYGVAFTKDWARKSGVNPVWYLDITPDHDWLTNPLQQLIDQALEQLNLPFTQPGGLPPVLRLTPFIEQMGTGTRRDGTTYRKEFAWEREWRHNGTFNFSLGNAVAIFAPENDHLALSPTFYPRLGPMLAFLRSWTPIGVSNE